MLWITSWVLRESLAFLSDTRVTTNDSVELWCPLGDKSSSVNVVIVYFSRKIHKMQALWTGYWLDCHPLNYCNNRKVQSGMLPKHSYGFCSMKYTTTGSDTLDTWIYVSQSFGQKLLLANKQNWNTVSHNAMHSTNEPAVTSQTITASPSWLKSWSDWEKHRL